MTAGRSKFQQIENLIKKESSKEIRDAKKILKAQAKATGKPFKELWAKYEADKKAEMEMEVKAMAEAKAKEEAEYALNHPTQEQLLAEIRDLLKENKENK